eukprot:10669072-Heterocapsa_arctica.AAC.1
MDTSARSLASHACGERSQRRGTRLLEEDLCASGSGLALVSPGMTQLCHYHDQTYTSERLAGKCEYLTCYHQGTMMWEGIRLCARHMDPALRSGPPGDVQVPHSPPRSAVHVPDGRWEEETGRNVPETYHAPAGNDPRVTFAP